MPDEVELHFSSAGYVGAVIRANKQAKPRRARNAHSTVNYYQNMKLRKQGYILPLYVYLSRIFAPFSFYVKCFGKDILRVFKTLSI